MNKLTVNSLAFGNLKARKKQYVLMIIGIIFAMIFSSGTMFLVSSIISGAEDLQMRSVGRENNIYFGMTDESLDEAIRSGFISDYTEGENIGYIFKEKEMSGSVVARLTPEAVDMTYTVLVEGRYPEKKGEIALETNAFLKLKSQAKVGDKLTVNFKVQSGNGYLDEVKEKTYTLTGIISDRRINITDIAYGKDFVPSAFVSAEEEIDAGGKAQRIVFAMRPKEGNYSQWLDFVDSRPELDSSEKALWLYGPTSNSHYMAVAAIKERGALLVLLAAVLMLVSCIGIINAFNSNLLERKKQIGLLRAVGTTRRQIINIFGREAFIITLVCTPISVVISYFLTKLVISLAGGGMIFIPNFAVLAIGTVFSVLCVMLAALVPLFRASRISPMQAVRNIEMTRKLRKKKIKQKSQFDVPLLTAQRNLTFSRGRLVAVSVILIVTILLSSLGISFLVGDFKHGNTYKEPDYYVNIYSRQFSDYYNAYRKNSDVPITPNDINEILRIPYVKSVSCREDNVVNFHYTEENKYVKLQTYSHETYDLTGEFQNTVFDSSNYVEIIEAMRRSAGEKYGVSDADIKEKFGFNDEIAGVNMFALEDENLSSLKSSVAEGKINIDKINSGEEIVLLMPKKVYLAAQIYSGWVTNNIVSFGTYFGTSEPQFLKQKDYEYILLDSAEAPYHAGDEIDLSIIDCYYTGTEGVQAGKELDDSECFNKKVKIGAIIEFDSTNYINISAFNNLGGFGVITTHGGLRSFGIKNRISEAEIYLNGECTEEINQTVMDVFESLFADKNDPYIYSDYEMKQDNDNTFRAMFISLVSVVLLLLTVCANLVNNSITAGIRENKRGIGTLRALGASLSDLTKSYIYQLLYMLGIGSVVGTGLFALVAIGVKIYEKVTGTGVNLIFYYYIPVLICAVLFAICTLNLYIQLRKITNTSIVDNIREL